MLLKKKKQQNCNIKPNENISHGVYTNMDVVYNAECCMSTVILKPKHHASLYFVVPPLLRAFSQACAPSSGMSRNSMPLRKQ